MRRPIDQDQRHFQHQRRGIAVPLAWGDLDTHGAEHFSPADEGGWSPSLFTNGNTHFVRQGMHRYSAVVNARTGVS